MRWSKLVSMTALGLVGLPACSSVTEPPRDEAAALQTDRLSYEFHETQGYYSTAVIDLALVNTSDAPAFLPGGVRHVELALEGQDESGAWVTRYLRNVPDAGSGTVRLEPGEEVRFRTVIEGFLPDECDCHPTVDLEDGLYRFRIVARYVDAFDEETLSAGAELPEHQRISNRFYLKAP